MIRDHAAADAKLRAAPFGGAMANSAGESQEIAAALHFAAEADERARATGDAQHRRSQRGAAPLALRQNG